MAVLCLEGIYSSQGPAVLPREQTRLNRSQCHGETCLGVRKGRGARGVLGAQGDDDLYPQEFLISERTPYPIGSPSFVIREKLTLS